LANIRDGHLQSGRAEIEIAASLNPESSLTRSYLGKAYYEENRDELAATQFDLAKERDPRDPTSSFYDAILKQSHNRPVEALRAFQKSIDLNDDRAVYRSRLLLDEDIAARSVSLARIYQDLHFDQLGLLEGTKSLEADFANYSAHHFLADTYATLPRHEQASASELLQSLLWQPQNLNPVPALRPIEEGSLGLPPVGRILRGLGPSQVSLNEFNPLFARDGLSLYLDGLAGSKNTLTDQTALTGIESDFSFSLGQGYVQTDGFSPNSDFKQQAYDALVQASLSPNASIQAEINVNRFRGGQFESPNNPDFPSPARTADNATTIRAGGSVALSPASHVLISGIFQTRDVTTSNLPDASISSRSNIDANTE